MNRDRNMFKCACDMVWFYNINCRLTFFIYELWSIWDLEFKVFRKDHSHWTILEAKYKVRTLESAELAAEAGWVLAYQRTATPKMQRTMQAMSCFLLGARTSIPYEKSTRPLNIFWEWKSPGETSWWRSWVVVPASPVGFIMEWCGQTDRYQIRCLIPWQAGVDGA